jgi:uncharacterized protein DUF4276
VTVRIYVEGGGEGGAATARCREAFAELLGKIVPKGQRPKVLPCGSRQETFADYLWAVRKYKGDLVLLLVDSEGPVAEGIGPWAHLKRHDNWEPPAGATDEHAHLMVQCMEAWFLMDREALQAYYGQGFRPGALPRQVAVEQIARDRILKSLQQAARATQKKEYHKTRHGFELLKRIDPAKVQTASPHFRRLCEVLSREASR